MGNHNSIEAVRIFLKPSFIEVAQHIVNFQLNENYIGMLQEWSVPQLGEEPKYDLVNESGADHDKEFTLKVYKGGKIRYRERS